MQMQTKKERSLTIDVLKGIATISVLVGHSIQRGLGIPGGNYIDNLIFKIIYTFHMPLFMILAGYVLANYTSKYNSHFLIKKIRRLLYPTILWSFLIWCVRNYDFVGIKEFISFPNTFIGYSKELLLHPDIIIWFLYDLFIFNIWFYVLRNINKQDDVFLDLLLSALFYLILLSLPSSNFGIYNLQTYFPIFAFGYYFKKDYLKNIHLC